MSLAQASKLATAHCTHRRTPIPEPHFGSVVIGPAATADPLLQGIGGLSSKQLPGKRTVVPCRSPSSQFTSLRVSPPPLQYLLTPPLLRQLLARQYLHSAGFLLLSTFVFPCLLSNPLHPGAGPPGAPRAFSRTCSSSFARLPALPLQRSQCSQQRRQWHLCHSQPSPQDNSKPTLARVPLAALPPGQVQANVGNLISLKNPRHKQGAY